MTVKIDAKCKECFFVANRKRIYWPCNFCQHAMKSNFIKIVDNFYLDPYIEIDRKEKQNEN